MADLPLRLVPVTALAALLWIMALAPKAGPVVLIAGILMLLSPATFAVLRGQRAPLRRLISNVSATLAGVTPLITVIGLFLMWCAVSLAWVPDPDDATGRAGRMIALFLLAVFYAVLAGATGERSALSSRSALLGFAGYMIGALCIGLSFFFVAPGKASPDAFINRTIVVLALSAFVISAYVLTTDWSARARTALVLVMLATGFGFALASNSQTAAVAFCIGLSAAALCAILPRLLRRALVIALVAAGFCMPLLIGWLGGFAKPLLALPFLAAGSSADRMRIWESYLFLVQEKPMFGWGIEASRNFDPTLLAHAVSPDSLVFSNHPHNAFLQVWADLGGLGAGLYCLLLALVGWRIEQCQAQTRPLLYGLFAAFVTAAAISHGAFQSWWMGSIAVLFAAIVPLMQHEPGAGARSAGTS
ncbi:MAG: O-antigen ligase family protein [Pseudomonadota bacterium]